MKRFLFLLAWISGSEGESDNLDPGECTKVKSQEDLSIEFFNNNEHVFAREIFAPNYTAADALGYKEAFFDNFTAHDTLSMCREITQDLVLPAGTPALNFDSLVNAEGVRERLDNSEAPVSNDDIDYASTTND